MTLPQYIHCKSFLQFFPYLKLLWPGEWILEGGIFKRRFSKSVFPRWNKPKDQQKGQRLISIFPYLTVPFLPPFLWFCTLFFWTKEFQNSCCIVSSCLQDLLAYWLNLGVSYSTFFPQSKYIISNPCFSEICVTSSYL